MHTYGEYKGSGTSTKLYPTVWVFNFWHLLYVRHEYYVTRKI